MLRDIEKKKTRSGLAAAVAEAVHDGRAAKQSGSADQTVLRGLQRLGREPPEGRTDADGEGAATELALQGDAAGGSDASQACAN